MLMNWKEYFGCTSYNTFLRSSQFVWCNSYIKIDNKALYLKSFSERNINFITPLFHSDGSVKKWNILKTEYALQNKDYNL